MAINESDRPLGATTEEEQTAPKTRSELAALNLARLETDGSYTFAYIGDHSLVKSLFSDRIEGQDLDQKKLNSLSGEAKRARDTAVGRLEGISEGESDPIGEKILRVIRESDSRHENISARQAIAMLNRENPHGYHKPYNAAPRVDPRTRKPKEYGIKEEPKSPPLHRTTKWGYQNRALIEIEEQPLIILLRPDSIASHPLWPKPRPQGQIEKYVYALALPGEDSAWHFASLREVITNLNATSLQFDPNGQDLTPLERETKIDDMLEGAKMMIRKYAIPDLIGSRDYYRDPIHYPPASRMARDILSWLRHIQSERKPDYDAFIERLTEATDDHHELHVA